VLKTREGRALSRDILILLLRCNYAGLDISPQDFR
jgi:hypothetical protein